MWWDTGDKGDGFSCVHCASAMAVMDFKLLVFQDLKTYCVIGADAIAVALSSGKP